MWTLWVCTSHCQFLSTLLLPRVLIMSMYSLNHVCSSKVHQKWFPATPMHNLRSNNLLYGQQPCHNTFPPSCATCTWLYTLICVFVLMHESYDCTCVVCNLPFNWCCLQDQAQLQCELMGPQKGSPATGACLPLCKRLVGKRTYPAYLVASCPCSCPQGQWRRVQQASQQKQAYAHSCMTLTVQLQHARMSASTCNNSCIKLIKHHTP